LPSESTGKSSGFRTVLGVDPGTRITGYAIIRKGGGRVRALEFGAIRTGPEGMPGRLAIIYEGIVALIRKFSPDEFAIETAFYGKNAQSALKLGHARGVSILAAVLAGMPTSEYSPREVKKAVTGSGSASKQQVRFMVQQILGLPSSEASGGKRTPGVYDASDALAVALCHLQRPDGFVQRARTSRRRRTDAWDDFLRKHPERVLPPRGGRP